MNAKTARQLLQKTLCRDTKKFVYLGKGLFAFAFHDTKSDSVYLVSAGNGGWLGYDSPKERLAHYLPDNLPHAPKIEIVDAIDSEYYLGSIFKMPYYRPLTPEYKATPEYKSLSAAYKKALARFVTRLKSHSWYNAARDLLEYMREYGAPVAVIETARKILDAAANAGDSVFLEFTPRNLSLDAAGNLVLRDIVFDAKAAAALACRGFYND